MINTLVFIVTVLFWILFMGRTVLLARQGVKVFVLGKGKRLREKIIEIVLVPLLVIWTAQIFTTSFGRALIGLPVMWVSPTIQWIGFSLCVTGLLIFLSALISFGNAWRVGIDEKNSNRLVTSGIFAYSRNPIFLFMDMYFFGIFLIYPTLFFLAFFVCFAAGIHLQILNEERFLQSKFGAEYETYRNCVRRYAFRHKQS